MSSVRKAFFIGLTVFAVVFVFAFVVSSAKANGSAVPVIEHRFFAQDSIDSDTAGVKTDSTIVKEYKVQDSTYLEQLTYRRKDSEAAQAFPPSQNPFYLKPPAIVFQSVQLDSTGEFVIVRQMVNGKDVRFPVKVPLEEYVRQRAASDIEKNFSDLVLKEESAKVSKKKDDLGDLLGAFTKIDIPVPANPVFSIFGPPRINLTISGAVDIRAAFRNTTTDQQTTSAYGNTRNEPDFAQEVQINVSGTIGDKLNILADWNTQRTFEYENQLRIKYTGYEDEIVQSVEAGNVSLSTNSSFVSSSSALFGIKTALQIGPLKLTAIASQKKGQIQEKSITGGAQEIEFTKRAWEYSKDHFFVDTAYFSSFGPYITTQTLNADQSRLIIKANEYEVWLYHTGAANETMKRANAFFNLPSIGVDELELYRSLRDPSIATDALKFQVAGNWDKLEPIKDYVLNPYTGQLTMNRSVQDGQAIAISYRTENGSVSPDDDRIYGTSTKTEQGIDSVLVLKLVKPLNYILPQDKVLFSLMMKNIYPLGGRKIQKDGFFLEMRYQSSATDAVDVIGKTKIIKLFGLDRNGESGNTPDDKFDFTQYTIDQERGEIIFPTLRPFTDGLRAGLLEFEPSPPDTLYLKYIYDDLYDTTSIAAQNNNLKDKFVITGKITASSSNTINLGFNVVEGSVQVLLDGQILTPNIDYTVDYIIGQVVIRKQEALVPGKNLQVKFEQNDLFQLASKTLMGLRGEVDVSEKTKFGFTVMNLDQQVLSDKVRLNEEPSNNTIYGFDGQTSGEVPYLTKAIDALPFLDSKAKSEFTLRGEAAYMNPDPNTKKSSIANDNGKGIAYIDDFEGAKRIIPIGVGYGQWHDISAPKYQFNIDSSLLIPDLRKTYSKAKAYWFNPPNGIPIDDIYGTDADGNSIKQVGRGQDVIQVLRLNYKPQKRGAYNFSPDLDSTLLREPKKNWAGIQKLISISAVNLIQENVGFIEIWVKVIKGSIDSTRKVFIDLGTISEDIIPNGTWETEDKGTFKNDILNPGEDTGIDGLLNAEEQNRYASFVESKSNKIFFPEIVNDPSGDDYNYTDKFNFEAINLTEGNSNSEIGRFPDSEDLNRNSIVDQANNYYEYELKLDTVDNPLKVGGGSKGWYQYRIPINAFKDKIGAPDQTNIQYARMWFTGHPEEFEMQFVEFNLIGNQWEEAKKNDPTFKVSVVNIEDNSLQGYSSPPGVFRERDRTKPDEQVYGNEQSLALDFFDLPDGESREAIKKYSYRPLDVFSYREMKMFVHGSENLKTTADKPSVKMYIRFGSDSLNYYEYKAPVYPGWDSRNDIAIRFADITSLKQGRKNENVREKRHFDVDPEGSEYAVLGNPTLTRITFISVGVENPVIAGTEQKITGQVWVNELRLADVDDTPGWAYSISTSVKLADLGSVAFTYSQVDPFFHSLENRFGSRVTNKSWNVSTAIAFERFLPTEWSGTQLPFSYSHSEQVSTPLYKPSSDVLVTKAADQQRAIIIDSTQSTAKGDQEKEKILSEAQTLSTTDTYAVPTFKLNVPSNNWFFRDIFNRIGYGFSYTTSSMRNPTTASRTSWQWNARVGYAYSFSPENFIQPFGFFENLFLLEEFRQLQLFYIPISNINTGFTIARSRSNERLRSQTKDSDPIRGLSSSRNFSFAWKLTENGLLNISGDYSLDVSSSMVHLELDRYGRQRDFQQIMNQIFLQDQFINFGFDNSYNQSFTVNTRPRVPAIFDINKYVTLTARYNVGYRWQNSLQQGTLGISTGWGNSITFTSDVSLKAFVETWFPAQSANTESVVPLPGSSRGVRDRDDEDSPQQDTPPTEQPLPLPPVDTASVVKKASGDGLIGFARILIKTPFLDYDKINVNFTQNNSSSNGGVPGRPGFTNFFGRVPFVQQSEPEYGPTRAYQLGLVSSPGASITDVFLKPQFPFVGFITDADKEIRARGAQLTDGFTQGNKLTFRTSRDLWTGARLDLNWNLGWNYSRTSRLNIDSLTGRATSRSIATGGSIDRSFFTLPPVFIFSMFKNGIEQVGKLYTASVPADNAPNQDQKLAKAFEEGFESLPILKKLFGEFFPRVNYSFRWDGLEQMSLFKNFATRVSLDHAYQSNYTRTFIGSVGGGDVTQSQRISYAFAPLAGLSVSFKEVLKGTMSANVRYGSNVTYDLSPSTKNIVESVGNDMSITGSFAKSGFEIPLFGLSLQNDIDISFTYSLAKNSRTTFDAKGKTFNTKGTPGEGSTRTQMEPRVRYVLSARVTASLFYRYTKIAPDEGGSRIPGSTTNEGGVDVHIAIQ
ncbi:MAG: cell surface protein SprA [Bacteroidota bacterium]|nr:cell surface protein SprA [Bacteroidota bacterium]